MRKSHYVTFVNLFHWLITFSCDLKNNRSPLFFVPAVALLFLLFPLPSDASLSLRGKLNINDAAKSELLLLPHIGNVKAESIYNYRKKEGSFSRLDSLLNVKGLGRKTYEKILPYIKLSGLSDLSIQSETNGGSPLLHYEGASKEVLLLENGDFYKVLLEAVKKAKKSIDLSMFLFKSSSYESNRANIVLHAIASAAERGVKVSVLLEESKRNNDSVTMENRKSAEKLIKRGVNVSFDSPDRTTHTKAIVIDSRFVFIGSHNFTHSALRYNNELSLLVDSEELAGKTLNYMKGIN